MTDWAEIHDFGLDGAQVLGLADPRRKELVIQERLDTGESLQPHQLFAVELPIGFLELGVALVGDLAESVIERHDASLGCYR